MTLITAHCSVWIKCGAVLSSRVSSEEIFILKNLFSISVILRTQKLFLFWSMVSQLINFLLLQPAV